MRHYATVAHARQVPVLLASMHQHCGDFALHVLAWDYETVGNWGEYIHFTARADFLARHPDLAPSRLPGPPRRPINITDTVRWQFFADVMEATGEPLCWLDGDQWFFSSPDPLYAELTAAGARLAVSPHRIPPRAAGLPGVTAETHGIYGTYNSGFGWASAPAPLREMAALCREWSYSEVVPRPGRRPLFGDQAHLEDVAERHGAHVIQHPGVNLAPWNIHAHRMDDSRDGTIWVDDKMLISYHYSSLRLNPDGSLRQLADPAYGITPWQASLLYEPYLRALRAG